MGRLETDGDVRLDPVGARRRDQGNRMTLYQIDPLRGLRWTDLLERHSRASVFHTPGWLDAIRGPSGKAFSRVRVPHAGLA